MTRFKFSRRIGSGGMADVFLALQEGLGGFEKLVVVKRIFPHLCLDQSFVQMFFDEARLAASIRHPNVVEILDIQRDEAGFFIVMEYLSGETVEWLIEDLHERGQSMAWPVALRIAADVAEGLHAAHTAVDEEDRPRGIVHRDVTPSNLVVCYSGATKVLDFGVAKFEASDEEAGTLKGKLGYLAPEQLTGGPVDARTDVFQLGVVLYEMLTGHRVFGEAADHDSMREVLERPVAPPSAHRPDLPAEVDELVLACLAADPAQRCGSAAEARAAIEKVLAAHGHSVGSFEVAAWMSSALADRREERKSMERAALREMRTAAGGRGPSRPSEVPAMFDDGTGEVASGKRRRAGVVTVNTLVDRPVAEKRSVGPAALLAASEGQGNPRPKRVESGGSRWRIGLAVAALLALGIAGAKAQFGGEDALVQPHAAARGAEPADGRTAGRVSPRVRVLLPHARTADDL